MGVIPDRKDFVRRLVQGGAYTEMQASVMADALEATFDQPASRIDLLEAKADLTKEIADLRAETRKDIGDLRAETRKDIGDLRTEVRVLAERVERLADRTLIRVAAVMVVLLTAAFGIAFRLATSVWPPPP